MKYFFLAEGWKIGRVWAAEGLWQEMAWRRQPDIKRLNISLVSESEIFWLYRAEEAVLTLEVKPVAPTPVATPTQAIGQVVLKRLMCAEEVIERLDGAEAICHLKSLQSVVK